MPHISSAGRIGGLVALLLLVVFASPEALAQPAQAARQGPDIAVQRAAMERLSGMAGDWTGEAAVAQPVERTVYQREHIAVDMNGLLLVIHGAGFGDVSRTGAPIFNAFGVISYDDARQIYEFRVYNDGRAATAQAVFLPDGRLQWTMNFSPVIIRYTITLAGDRWNEIGEMSRDNGTSWTRTVELNLTRQR